MFVKEVTIGKRVSLTFLAFLEVSVGCHPCHHDIDLAIVESFTAFLHGLLDSLGCHGTEPLFAHLCLQLRSSTASWCRAYFVSQRADALHWIVR